MAACAALIVWPAEARAGEPDDPFPVRSQLPFGLLFLDQTPRSARIVAARRLRLDLHSAYENTFAATDRLVTLFRQDQGNQYHGRVTLPILETAAAGTPAGTGFVLDGEVLRSVVDVAFGIGPRFEAGAEIPLLLHTSGFLDPAIDGYHAGLGLPDGGRTAFAKNRYVVGYVGDGREYFSDHPAGGVGLGDIVIYGRGALARDHFGWPDVALGVSVKLPSGDPRRLDGSGRADYGASLQVSGRIGRSSLHGGYEVTRVGGWSLAPGVRLVSPRSQFGAYGFAVTSRSTVVVQILRSSGPFRFRSGSDLGRVALEIAAGLRYHVPRGFFLEWAVLENLDPYYNTPDVGTFLGLSFSE